MRTSGPLGILAACCAVAALAVGSALASGAPPRERAPSRTPGTAAGATSVAVQALRDWDDRREAAWRDADVVALRDLYVPGSGAGRADAALLERWRAAGWRVAELRTQVLGVGVVEQTPARLRLRVTDRLAGGELRRGDLVRPLPASSPTTRALVLHRGPDGRWRVSASA